MAFSITGQIKVATLKKRFHREFGLTLRVYDGRSFADEDKTIGQIRKKKGSGELSIKKNMKVGTLEEKIEEEFGIKVQIAGSDDSYLCKNELTLASAHEKDQKRINKKDKHKHQKAIRDSMPSHIMTAAEWEYATDDYKELREKPKMNVTQFKEYRNIIDESISGKENENNVDKTSESTLTEDQIKEFKESEKNAEDSYDLTDLGDEIVEAGDKEWAKKVYRIAEDNMAVCCGSYRCLADSIHENLGDKEWAKKVYETTEEKAEDSYDFESLAGSVRNNLGDKKWGENVLKNAEAYFFRLISPKRPHKSLA